MKIGILSQWFDPEPGPASLPGTLARSLAARGHEVQVLTGFPNYPDGKIAPGYRMRRCSDEVVDGVNIRRVALYPSHSTSIVGRLLNYVSFGLSAFVSGVSVFKDCDAVWVSNSPVTVGIPMWRITRHQKTPILLHIMDLWPDNITSSGLIRSRFIAAAVENLIHRWNSAMYRSATSIAGISKGIVELVASRGVPAAKLHYVPLWANEQFCGPSSDMSFRANFQVPDDRVVVLYAGTLGRTQDIETLILACHEYPESEPPIECWIAGSGVEAANLKATAAAQQPENVVIRFVGRVQTAQMKSLMTSADVHFIGLRDDPNSAITMPSKVQATMASGRPIIVAISGNAEEVVLDAGAGFRAGSGSSSSVTSAIVEAANLGRDGLRLMGESSRRYYEANFSVDAGTEHIERLLNDAVVRSAWS